MKEAIKSPASHGVAAFFRLQKYQTSIRIELIAGLSTYLSLAYIFIVTPAILGKSGIDPSAVLFATVVASALATLAMGLWANLPFAVAPGLEMSGFFAFVVAGSLHMTWQQGLGTVFISGLLCILFTSLNIRKEIIDSIPLGLKRAIGTSVGVFVATIGLFLAHIVTFKDGRVDIASLSLAALTSHLAIILYIGLGLSVLFGVTKLRFPGGLLVSILVGAGLCALWGIQADTPPVASSAMFGAVAHLDLSVLFAPQFWSPVLIFFIIDFLGGIGKFIGLTANTNIQDEKGEVPNLARGLYVDGAGTMLGSFLGTSSLIAFVESAVGINAGGRTGLTALVCGCLMALTILATPVLRWIPAEAASGVLIFVGYLLLPRVEQKPGAIKPPRFDIIIASIMGLVSFLTFSLDKAMAIGFLAYFVQAIIRKDQRKSVPIWLAVVALLLIATISWQAFSK